MPVWRRAMCVPSAQCTVIAGGTFRSAIWVGLSVGKIIRLLIAGVAQDDIVQ